MIDSMKTIKPSYFITILEGSVGIKYILKLEENHHELLNIMNARGQPNKTKPFAYYSNCAHSQVSKPDTGKLTRCGDNFPHLF